MAEDRVVSDPSHYWPPDKAASSVGGSSSANGSACGKVGAHDRFDRGFPPGLNFGLAAAAPLDELVGTLPAAALANRTSYRESPIMVILLRMLFSKWARRRAERWSLKVMPQ